MFNTRSGEPSHILKRRKMVLHLTVKLSGQMASYMPSRTSSRRHREEKKLRLAPNRPKSARDMPKDIMNYCSHLGRKQRKRDKIKRINDLQYLMKLGKASHWILSNSQGT